MEISLPLNEKSMSGPKIEEIRLEEILYALSDLNRLRIVYMIYQAGGELRCGRFAEEIGVSKPTVSHHFGVLRASGVISTRMEGTVKHNKLRIKDLDHRFPGLMSSILTALPIW